MSWDFQDDEWREAHEDYQMSAGQDAADREEWAREHATMRVTAFLAARQSMGDNVDKDIVLDVWVQGKRYRLTTDDLRILTGWDGEPMAQPERPLTKQQQAWFDAFKADR